MDGRFLASNVNLVTHYAKGTLFFEKISQAAYKTSILNNSLTVLFSDAHVSYLAFEEGSPVKPNQCITWEM